jgi:ATP-binding cassette subfamily B protein
MKNPQKKRNNQANPLPHSQKNTQNKAEKQANQGSKTFRRLLHELRPHLLFIILSLFLALVQVVVQLLVPILVGNAIDYIVAESNVDFPKVVHFAVLLLFAVPIAAVFQFLSGVFAGIAASRTVSSLRIKLFEKLNLLPVKTIEGMNRGDLVARMTQDAERISEGLVQGFTSLFSGVCLIVGTLCFMLSINVLIALAVILLTPISIVVAFLIAKNTRRVFSRQLKAEGDMVGHTEEYISALSTVKLHNYSAASEKKFDLLDNEIKNFGGKAVFYSAIINPSSRLINGLVYLAALLISSALIFLAGSPLSVGAISALLTYSLQYARPFNEITGVMTEMQLALSSAARLFEILDKENEKDESDLPAIEFQGGNVEFCDVSFSYSDTSFIQHLFLSAKKGQKVAIVGHTGCGKTTLLSLIMRFYETTAGKIEVDGKDIQQVNRNSLRRNIGMVLQDSWLFLGSVRENLTYGSQNVSDFEIMEAAKIAGIDTYINNLKQGLDTQLDPASLSEGERQLFCIARVIVARPSMLILDEATSNIDSLSEIKIQQAVDEIAKDKTSFIVAHRLSTVRNADLILVMEEGKIVEQGTHSMLMKKDGHYKKLLSYLEEN